MSSVKAPAVLESTRLFLTVEWRSLLMVNYTVNPAVLKEYLPYGTELELWNGQALVSIVGFLFLDTRVFGFAVPFHRHFEEVNLRLYVRRKGPDGWRRGVVFVKEIVPRRAIAAIARLAYNEQYVALPMRHRVALDAESGGSVQYDWRSAGSWHSLAAEVVGPSSPMSPGTQEEFIFEHYWGYTRQRNGETIEYEVRHDPWRVWKAQNVRFECDVAGFYGSEWRESLSASPVSAFVAEGSFVEVRRGVRLSSQNPHD